MVVVPVCRLPYELRLCLHLSCSMCPLRAVVLVNSAPQLGHVDFAAWPDFSRWCRRRLLNVENWRPLQPCSQHWGLGRLWTTRTWLWSAGGVLEEAVVGSIPYIGVLGIETGGDRLALSISHARLGIQFEG